MDVAKVIIIFIIATNYSHIRLRIMSSLTIIA